jgi:hypothetical protein
MNAMFLNTKIAKAFALATGALLLPAAAAHAEEVTLQRDGVTYVYTVTPKKDRTVIAGTADRMTPFRLVVRGSRVTGEYNHRQVAFSMSDMKAGAAAVAVR